MTNVDDNALAHADVMQAHVLDVVVWATKLKNTQRLTGIVAVTLRDPVRESSQRHNEIA